MKVRILPFLLVAVAVANVRASEEGEVGSETNLVVRTPVSPMAETSWTATDLSEVWPVEELAPIAITYSSVGWGVTTIEAGASVRIVAESGEINDGVWSSDGSSPVVLATDLSGTGSVTWDPQGVSKAVYRLTHDVQVSSVSVPVEKLLGYFDFTQCKTEVSEAEIRLAGFDATDAVTIENDADSPWAPLGGRGEGLATPTDLAVSETSDLALSFSGAGTFRFEWMLSGGTLQVLTNGVVAQTLTRTGDGWSSVEIDFGSLMSSTVVFRYVSAGGGKQAGVKGISWLIDPDARYAEATANPIVVDLRTGVRTIFRREEILPFAYSHTNFTGYASATEPLPSGDKVAKVTVVRLTGSDPDVSAWTEEVPGSERILANAADESEVVWRGAKAGVWKAVFDILSVGESVHQETAIFDLRNMRAPGLVIFLR